MRVECGSCKRVADARFEPAEEGTAIAVTCSACGVRATALLAEKTPVVAAIAVSELCPKCGTTRTADAKSCRSCGLASERMAAFAASRDAAVPAEVRTAWTALGDSWTVPAHHDALLLLIARHNCYAWAAGRYRDASRSRAGDTVGPAQLERLRRAAEATMFATASARPERGSTPYAAVFAILGVLVVALVGGFAYAELKTNEAPPAVTTRFQVR